MKKILLILPLAFCLLISWTGGKEIQDSKLTFTDQTGRTITLPGLPGRVVSMAPSVTETIYAVGGSAKLAGVTEYCNYPPEAAKLPRIGGFADINIEKVIELAPDLVFGTSLHLPKILPALEALDIPVFLVNQETLGEVEESILLVARLLDKEAEGENLLETMSEQQAVIEKKLADSQVTPLRVYWELSGDLWTAGPDSYINELITIARGINIAGDADSDWVQLSPEVVVEKNPQVIFLADHLYGENLETVAARPGWDVIDAVKNKRVVEITDIDPLSRPGPRAVEALEFIARNLHPGAFTR